MLGTTSGACLPCLRDDQGLVGEERDVFEDLLGLWLRWPHASREWRHGLVELRATGPRRFSREGRTGALTGR